MPSPVAVRTVQPYASLLSRPIEDVAQDLERFCALVTKWNAAQNLVSRETADALWSRHVADSLQLVRLLSQADGRFVDIGSGGGFPALPLAIALKGSGASHLLIESNSKKASFLRACIRELGIAARVEAVRAERSDSRETPHVVTARAVAPLQLLLGLCAPWLVGSARGLFHKGREYGHEVEAARKQWRFDVAVHPSDVDPSGVVLEVRNLSPFQRFAGEPE